MTKIKVEKEETRKEPKTVKIEFTRVEVIELAAWMQRIQETLLQDIVEPSRHIRRAIRNGKITKDELVDHYRIARELKDKIVTATIGVNPEELAEEIRKFMEEE